MKGRANAHKVRNIQNAVSLCSRAVDDKLVCGLLFRRHLPLHQGPFLPRIKKWGARIRAVIVSWTQIISLIPFHSWQSIHSKQRTNDNKSNSQNKLKRWYVDPTHCNLL